MFWQEILTFIVKCACTAWCSEIGYLTSLDACNSGASSDVREPVSLHQAVYVNRQVKLDKSENWEDSLPTSQCLCIFYSFVAEMPWTFLSHNCFMVRYGDVVWDEWTFEREREGGGGRRKRRRWFSVRVRTCVFVNAWERERKRGHGGGMGKKDSWVDVLVLAHWKASRIKKLLTSIERSPCISPRFSPINLACSRSLLLNCRQITWLTEHGSLSWYWPISTRKLWRCRPAFTFTLTLNMRLYFSRFLSLKLHDDSIGDFCCSWSKTFIFDVSARRMPKGSLLCNLSGITHLHALLLHGKTNCSRTWPCGHLTKATTWKLRTRIFSPFNSQIQMYGVCSWKCDHLRNVNCGHCMSAQSFDSTWEKRPNTSNWAKNTFSIVQRFPCRQSGQAIIAFASSTWHGRCQSRPACMWELPS